MEIGCKEAAEQHFDSAGLSVLARPATGPQSYFGLLLMKPIMSWKAFFFLFFAACQRAWARARVRVCVSVRVCVCPL